MRTLVALAGCLAVAVAQATPFAVPVGETRIGIDVPPGFADTSFTGSPRLRQLAESQTSPSNRLLVFAISDGDLRRFMNGDTPEFRRYLIVVTPRALEHEHMSAEAFRKLLVDAGKAADGVERLAELRSDRDAYSVLQRAALPSPPRGPFTGDKGPQYVLSTVTLLRLKGKAVNLSVYTRYDAPADLEWIRGTTMQWIDELQRLNTP